jgi:uncharacterized membrane protein YciS (DUF1049 family)
MIAFYAILAIVWLTAAFFAVKVAVEWDEERQRMHEDIKKQRRQITRGRKNRWVV